MLPLQITVCDMPSSPILEDHIRKKASKLSQYYRRINSIRIVIHVPQKHKHQGKLYSIHIDLTVPGKELVVNRQFDQDVYVAIRDAFNALQRQLESYSRKKRGDVKTHEIHNKGHIKRIFHDEGYGFIQGVDGNEYYFSANSIISSSFLQMEQGDIVRFIDQVTADGLQARHITLEKKNGHT